MSLLRSLTAALLLRAAAAFSDIHNSVLGLPEITCERDFIRFEVETATPFRGKLFVKGEYGNAACSRTFDNGHVVGAGSISGAQPSLWDHPGHRRQQEFGVEIVKDPPDSASNSGQGQAGLSGFGNGRFGHDEGDAGDSGSSHGYASGRTRFGAEGQTKGRQFDGRTGASFGASTTAPEGEIPPSGFGHAAGVLESGELPLKVFGGQPPGFPTRRPGGARGLESGLESELAGYASTTQQEGYSTRTPKAPTATLFIRPVAEEQKIYLSQCPTTCAPCPACPTTASEASFSRERRQARNTITLDVPVGQCHAKRDRVVSPPGVYVSFVAVVSFHESFITKLDRAYHIKCAYRESNKTVETSIDVSNPPSEELPGSIPPPQCQYVLKTQEGAEIRSKNVQVGDVVRHEWSCASPVPDMYGLHVHSCYVEDGKGDRQLLVDAKGCSVDTDVLPDPVYARGALSASVDAFVFKFPDRETLDFQCSLALCARQDGGCDGLTPPACSTGYRTRRSSIRAPTNVSAAEWTLHSPTLTVIDIDSLTDRLPPEELSAPGDASPSSEELCLSVAAFGVLVAATTFTGTAALGAIIAFALLRRSAL